jgi:hypothetical protein
MVYGRYNDVVFMVIISWFINQRSHHWGAHPTLKRCFSVATRQVEGVILALKRRWTGREPLVPLPCTLVDWLLWGFHDLNNGLSIENNG